MGASSRTAGPGLGAAGCANLRGAAHRARLSRPRGPGKAACRDPRGHSRGAPLHAAHAAERPADVGAHDQLRSARLDDRRAGLSLPGDPPGDRRPVAANSRPPDGGVADLAGYPPPPQACLVNFYGSGARMGLHQDRDEEDFDAPVVSLSLGDTCLFRIGGTDAPGPDPLVPARLRRRGGARRRGAARLPWRRPHHSRHLAPACRGRADQPDAAPRHARGIRPEAGLNQVTAASAGSTVLSFHRRALATAISTGRAQRLRNHRRDMDGAVASGLRTSRRRFARRDRLRPRELAARMARPRSASPQNLAMW